MDKLSQHGKILRLLHANTNGVENWRFARMGILNYTARLSELRKDGHNILTERVFANGRWTGTFKYYLIEERPRKTLLQKLKDTANA